VEQPAEESSFKDKISVPVWPVREYLGLVFAYLGEGEPPEFPRFAPFERFQGLVEVDSYLRECNYWQNVENSLDMSHVGYVHGDNRAAFDGIGLGRRLTATESDWGVTYTFERPDGRRRIQQWGMPNVFYMTALPTGVDWQESLFWWVPIDDTRHMQFSLHRVPVQGQEAEAFKSRREAQRTSIDLAHQDVCDQILGGMLKLSQVDRTRVDLVRLQDDIAQVGQGVFASENPERLGKADIGVAMIRRVMKRELAAMAEGRPLKQWQRTSHIVPRVWALAEEGEKPLATVEGDVEAEVIDIRPHVEVALQRQALHGVERKRSQ
jgi:5,5'-dehydrodivanillate O-demethylase